MDFTHPYIWNVNKTTAKNVTQKAKYHAIIVNRQHKWPHSFYAVFIHAVMIGTIRREKKAGGSSTIIHTASPCSNSFPA